MESDIIDKLHVRSQSTSKHMGIMLDAAAEITRLRSALTATDETIRVLREALEHFAETRSCDCEGSVVTCDHCVAMNALAASAKGGE